MKKDNTSKNLIDRLYAKSMSGEHATQAFGVGASTRAEKIFAGGAQ